MKDFERITVTTRSMRRRLAHSARVRVFSTVFLGGIVATAGVFLVKDQAVPRLEESLSLAGNAAPAADRPNADTRPEVAAGEPFNMLVVGVDRVPKRQRTEENSGTRADTLMLVRVEPDTGALRIVSIPRDLYVEISPGESAKINGAYGGGGPERVLSVVENYTRVTVDHIAIVDFKGFRESVDAMGGVKVDVGEDMPSTYKLEEGLHTLNGQQALFYARYRGTSGGDLDRMDRQRELVAALRSQALRWDTVTRLPKLVKVLNDNVRTSLEVNESLSLARALVEQGRGAELRSTKLEGTPETLSNGEEVLVPDDLENEKILADFRD